MEPPKRSQAVSDAILAQTRNSPRNSVVAIIIRIDRIKRDVLVRLQIIVSRVDQSPGARDSIAAHTGIRKGLCLKTRTAGVATVGEQGITVDLVVHAHCSSVGKFRDYCVWPSNFRYKSAGTCGSRARNSHPIYTQRDLKLTPSDVYTGKISMEINGRGDRIEPATPTSRMLRETY